MAINYPSNLEHNNSNFPLFNAGDQLNEGWYHVADLAARTAIPTTKRIYGAMVVVADTAYIYSDTNLSNWAQASSWTEVGTGSGGIALTDLSVDTVNPASTTVSSLLYDNTTGDFNFTPVDVTGKAEAQTLTQSGGTITGTINTSTGVFSLTAPSSGGGDALTTSDLGQFDTVNLTGLVDGNVLKWDNVNSVFEPFEINYTTLPGTPTLANVSLTGDYGDLNDRPLFVGTGSVTITETSASGQTTYTIDSTSSGSGTVTSVNTIAPVAGDVTLGLTSLSDTLASYTSGSSLKWDGTQWQQAVFLDGTSYVEELTNVGYSNPLGVTGQILYNSGTDTSNGTWTSTLLTATPTAGTILEWSGSAPAWVTPTYGPILTVEGDGSSQEGAIVLNCSQNSHGITIQSAPHADSATYSIVLPASAGTTGQILSKTATNQWQWIDAPGGAVDSVNGATGTVVLSGEDIDTTSSSNVTVTSSVNTAVSTANTANTTANGANTTANAAQTDATQALSDAATAQADATQGISDAATAQAAANGAQSTADAVALEVDNFQGGTTGQVFVKDTSTDYDGTWTTLPTVTGVPADTGSTSGDVLSTDGSGVYTWETPASTTTTPTNLTYAASTGVLTSSTQNNSGATIPEATTSDRGLMSSADKVRFDGIPAATAGSNGQVLSTDGSAYGWIAASSGTVTEDAVRLTNTVGAAGFYTIGGIPKTAGFTSMMVMDSAAGGVFWMSETNNVYLMNRNFLNSVSTGGFTTQQVEELEQTKKFMDAYGMASVEIDLINSDIKIVYVSTTEASLNMAALPSQDIRLSYSGSTSGSTVLFTLNDYKSRSGATVRYGVSSGLIDTAVSSLGSGATRIVWQSGVLPVTGIVQYDDDGFTAGVVKPTDIISVAMEAPSAKAYTVVLKMPHSGEVTEINTKLNAGTCDVQVSFGGTDLLASAQSTSSTLATGTSFSAAAFEAGDEVIVTVSNLGGSSDEDLTVSMSYNIVY